MWGEACSNKVMNDPYPKKMELQNPKFLGPPICARTEWHTATKLSGCRFSAAINNSFSATLKFISPRAVFQNSAIFRDSQLTCFVTTTRKKIHNIISLRCTILLKNSRQKSGKCSLSHYIVHHSAINPYVYTKNQFHSSAPTAFLLLE